MADKLKRRQFLKYTSLTSLGLLPSVRLLARATGTEDVEQFVNCAFRLADHRTLLNVELYFINVTREGNALKKRACEVYKVDDNPDQSFMIIRLPQQHIAEQYKDGILGPDEVLQARIAGYSFLVFRIFFDNLDGNTLPLNYGSLMNWNADYFRLVVRQNLNEPLFRISRNPRQQITALNAPAAENHYPLGYRAGPGLAFGFNNYPKAYQTKYSSSPVTAIEAPYGLIISPMLPDQDQYRFRWTFSKNGGEPNGNAYSFELWMATLKAERLLFIDNKNKQQKKEKYSEADNPAQFHNVGDDLLRIMIMGAADYYSGEAADPTNPFVKNLISFREYLPETTDRKNLVDLYINFKLAARAAKLSFTPIGICTTMELNNKDIAKNKNPLFQWKQSISFGRDQEVKVVNLVVDSCTGLKMLHVKTTKRITEDCRAFLHYREFLMPLEIEKDYQLYVNEDNLNKYSQSNYKANTPFKKIRFADMKPKRITVLSKMTGALADFIVPADGVPVPEAPDGSSNAKNALAFWPLEYHSMVDGSNRRFLEWEFIATDWHDNEIKLKKRLFVLTQSLAIDGNNSLNGPQMPALAIENVYAAAKNEINITLNTVEAIRGFVNTKLDAAEYNITDKWRLIHKTGEDYWLNLSDLYRSRLEKQLDEMEAAARIEGDKIEDKVMEEFALYKMEVMELGNRLFGDVNELVHKIELLAGAAEKQLIENFRNHFNGYLRDGMDLREHYRTVIVVKIQEFSNLRPIAAIIDATEELKALVVNIADIPNRITSETLELEHFLNALPGNVAARVKAKLEGPARELKRLVIEIESIEHAAKSKIEMAKEKIGYAVYRVEEDLKAAKDRIQQVMGEEWQKVYEAYSKKYSEINRQVSELQTEYILLRNNVRSVIVTNAEKAEMQLFDFFHEYSCFPQLHTAKVFIQNMNDLVHDEIPMKIKYAEAYFKNQADSVVLNAKDNIARLFAEIKQEAKEQLKGAMRKIGHEMGGIVNPALAADFLCYYQDKRVQAYAALDGVKEIGDAVNSDARRQIDEIKAVLNNNADEITKEYEQVRKDINKELTGMSQAAKDKAQDVLKELSGDYYKAKDQLVMITNQAKQSLENNISLAKMQAEDFFKGLEAKILGAIKIKDILGINFEPPKFDKKKNAVYYNFITENLKDVTLGPFAFIASDNGVKSKLIVHFEKSVVNSTYNAWTKLSDFQVSVFGDRLIVHFEKLEMISNADVHNKVSVKIGDVEFRQELAFLKALSEGIQIPGTGLTLKISPEGINADFFFALPNISGGVFSFNNLKFGVGVTVPFPTGGKSLSELVTRFSINSPTDKFAVGVAIFGGRGHFVLETTPKYISKIDCGIEFGGYLSLNLVIAQGEAFLMAGIRYVYFRDPDGETGMEFYAILTCGGNITVFGFIDISVCFVLCLRYKKYNGHSSLYGIATLSFSLKIAFFSVSFSLSFAKRISGSDEDGAADSGYLNRKHFLPNNANKVYNTVYIEEENDIAVARYVGNGDRDYDDDNDPPKDITLTPMFTTEGLKRYCHSFI